MRKINSRIKILLLAVVLIILSFIVIVINGKTYKLPIHLNNDISSIDDIDVVLTPEGIIKCTDKKLENGVLKLKFQSIKLNLK